MTDGWGFPQWFAAGWVVWILVVGPILWIRHRRKLRAWLPCPGYLELKKCPRCGATALEGEVQCVGCDLEPEDDSTWRELRGALYEETQRKIDRILGVERTDE